MHPTAKTSISEVTFYLYSPDFTSKYLGSPESLLEWPLVARIDFQFFFLTIPASMKEQLKKCILAKMCDLYSPVRRQDAWFSGGAKLVEIALLGYKYKSNVTTQCRWHLMLHRIHVNEDKRR